MHEDFERSDLSQLCGDSLGTGSLATHPQLDAVRALPDAGDAATPGSANSTQRNRKTTLRSIMAADVVTLAPETTIREAANLFAEKGISGAPVVAGGRVVGVVSMRDLLDLHAEVPSGSREEAASDWNGQTMYEDLDDGGENPAVFYLESWLESGADLAQYFSSGGSEYDVLDSHTVDEIMTRRLYALPPDTELAEAARYMLRHGVHRVLVLEDGRLVGMVTTTDFLRAIGDGIV